MATAKPKPADMAGQLELGFDLTDEHEALLAPKSRGKKSTPSVYLEAVRLSLETGRGRGIALTETIKAPWVLAQLYKAGKQLTTERTDGKKVRVTAAKREDSLTVKPFVGFKVELEDVPAETEVQA